MQTIFAALLLGLAYALATACADFWFSAFMTMGLGMPPNGLAAARAAGLELLLGVALGLLTSPIRLIGRRAWPQLLVMAAVWIGLTRYVAVNPAEMKSWLAAPAIGLVLVAFGALVARWFATVPWVVGAAILTAAFVTPHILATPGVEMGIARGEAVADAPDVVVIVLDTVRAANTSTYGYERETTPFLSRLADEGVLFSDATSPSTWSLPSHASLFTGWYPSAHGAHGEHRILSGALPTLAEVMWRNGYDTLCFTANPHISDGFGLTRGFAWSDRAYLEGSGGRSFVFIYRLLDLLGVSADDKGGAEVAGNFARWLAKRDEARPAFVFINFLEAHFPYHQVPAEFLARYTDKSPGELRDFSLKTFGAMFGRQLSAQDAAAAVAPTVDMYDAGVRYSDYLLENVVEGLRNAGRLEDTVLVVLSDHGEMLGERGNFGHGLSVQQPDIQVPLVVRYPQSIPAGSRVDVPISTVGVYATVLDLVGIDPPGPLHVGSLLPAIGGDAIDSPVISERFISQMWAPGKVRPLAHNMRYRVFRRGDYTLIEDGEGERFLFNVVDDPAQLIDLAGAEPELLATIAAELDDWEVRLKLPALDAPIEVGAEPQMDDATRARLEALGYTE